MGILSHRIPSDKTQIQTKIQTKNMKLSLIATVILPVFVVSRPTKSPSAESSAGESLIIAVDALAKDLQNSAEKAFAAQRDKTVADGQNAFEQTVNSNGDSAIAYLKSWAEEGKKILNQNGITVKNFDQKLENAEKILKQGQENLAETDLYDSFWNAANAYWNSGTEQVPDAKAGKP